MQILTNRARAGFTLLLIVGVVSVLGAVVLSARGADAGTDAPYSQEEMAADKTFRYEVSTYHRFGPLAAQIAGDSGIDVHPEHARLSGYVVADSNGNFSSSQSKVHDQNQTAWYTTEVDSDGNATVTNHRSGAVKTEVMPASALWFRADEVPPLGETLETSGWTRNGTDTFNGQAVEVYEITLSAEGREPASGIELPYVEDLEPVAFKERVMVSSALNFVLKHDRWSVDADNESVLIETTEILKAQVE